MADINLIVSTNAGEVTKDFDRLGNTVLSQVKKAQQLERGYRQLDNAFNKGQISAQKYARGISQIDLSIKKALAGQSQLTTATTRTAAAMNTMSAAQAVSTRRMGRGSVITQQAGYQVGDFLVQIQGGTNAFVAFGQQATQIAGTMTILGGKWVLIGSALGIIIPLVTALGAAFSRTKTDASFLADSLDAISPLLDTIAKVAKTLKEVFLDTANVIVNNLDRIIVYGLSLAGFFTGKLVAAFVAARVAAMGFVGALVAVRSALIRTGIGALIVGAGELVYQFTRLVKAAGGFGEAVGLLGRVFVEAVSNMVGIIPSIPLAMQVGAAKMNAWFTRELGSMLYKFTEFTWKVADGLNELFGTSLSGMRGDPLTGMLPSEEFNRAAMAIEDRASLLQETLEERLSGATSTEQLQKLKDLVASLGGGTDIDVRDWDLFGGKDKDGKESALEKLRKELALMEELVGKSEEYKYIREALGDSYKEVGAATIASLEEQYAAVQKLMELEEQRKQLVESVATSFTDGLTSIVDGTKSVKEAFRDMARAVIKQLWDVYVVQQIVGGITGMVGGGATTGMNSIPSNNPLSGMSGSQMLPQANGGAWMKGVQMYANGGVVDNPTMFGHSGGMGVMGEAGPEAIMPLKRGANGKLGVQMEGGSGAVNIVQNFSFSANGDESVKRIIAEAAPQIANMTQQKMIDQRRRGGAMKSTFG